MHSWLSRLSRGPLVFLLAISMLVKELIEKLQSLPPETIIATERLYDYQCSEHWAAIGVSPRIEVINGHLVFWFCSKPQEVREAKESDW